MMTPPRILLSCCFVIPRLFPLFTRLKMDNYILPSGKGEIGSREHTSSKGTFCTFHFCSHFIVQKLPEDWDILELGGHVLYTI